MQKEKTWYSYIDIMTDTFLIIITVGILLIVLAIALVLLPRILREKEQPQRVTEMDMVLSSFQTMGNELKALKGTMIIKERLAALGEISAGIAHEFRNPMSVISGYAKLLQRAFLRGMSAGKWLTAFCGKLDGMNAVMTELLGFSRSGTYSENPDPLRAFLDELVRSFAEKDRIRIVYLEIYRVMAMQHYYVRPRETSSKMRLRQGLRSESQRGIGGGVRATQHLDHGSGQWPRP